MQLGDQSWREYAGVSCLMKIEPLQGLDILKFGS